MKIIWRDKLNRGTFVFFDYIYFTWYERCGCDWQLFSPTCEPVFGHPNIRHVRGWYFQLGYWGGDIAWKSEKCYEHNQ